MWEYNYTPDPNELYHYGILGMKWGVRRYQNKDGSLTNAGRRHYYGDASVARAHSKYQEAQANRKTAKKLEKQARRKAIIPTQKNLMAYGNAMRDHSKAKNQEYRSEFEYKTKREAARIREKNIEFKEKSKYRQKLEEQYKKLGLSDEDAQAAANRKIRAEKILAASAALTVAACAAYAYSKHRKNKIDGIIKAGEALQRIEMQDTAGKLHDVFYVAQGKHDMARYKGLLGFQRARQTGHAYMMKLEAASDIKVASKEKAINTFGNLMRNDNAFRYKMALNLPGYYGETNLTNKQIKKLYENFNRDLVSMNSDPDKPAQKFYDALKSVGYGAIQDVNDMDYSGYKAKNPLIVFDNAGGNISVKSMTEMDQNGMGKEYAKELMKALGEAKVDNLLGKEGLAIAGIAGGSAAVSRASDPSKDKRLKKK